MKHSGDLTIFAGSRSNQSSGGSMINKHHSQPVCEDTGYTTNLIWYLGGPLENMALCSSGNRWSKIKICNRPFRQNPFWDSPRLSDYGYGPFFCCTHFEWICGMFHEIRRIYIYIYVYIIGFVHRIEKERKSAKLKRESKKCHCIRM